MSKEKKPNNVSNTFMERADISEDQAIRLTIERLAVNNPHIKSGYDAVLARQEKSLSVIRAHQEKQRKREVQRVKDFLLDKNDPQKHNRHVYKPRLSHGVSRSKSERLAENDALGIVLQDEEARIVSVQRKFDEDKLQYVSDAVKELQQHTQTFNRSARHERPKNRSRGDERGYDR